jgi:hypothetical protein
MATFDLQSASETGEISCCADVFGGHSLPIIQRERFVNIGFSRARIIKVRFAQRKQVTQAENP